jgi:pimeloyl-ACP methyl ester carboxylesterase
MTFRGERAPSPRTNRYRTDNEQVFDFSSSIHDGRDVDWTAQEVAMTGSALEGRVRTERLDLGSGSVSVLRGGDGPPLLVLHAAGGAAAWLPAHERLAEAFEVIQPDHPGMGDSDELASVEAMDDLVYHYLDVMDRLGLRQPAVVGFSFGGWIAAEIAVHSPERIGALVLVSPIGLRIPGRPLPDLFAMNPSQLVDILFQDPSTAAGIFPSEPDLELILRMYRDQGGFARFAWDPFLCNPKLERRLQRITAPTLVAWSRHDRVVPRAHVERYAARIPDARLEEVDRGGHALHIEQPAAVAELVTTFLAAR